MNIIEMFYDKKIFWFRIFGYGLHFTKSAGYHRLFSERYGFQRAYYIGPLRLEILKPNKI